jgi:SPP1 gp7 family putative phage head morphogenesis protein
VRNLKQAQKRIAEWSLSIADDETLAAGIYATSLQADLAGQLFVRTVELPELDPLRVLDDRPVPPFLRLTFEEALELFLDRRIMSPEAFQTLSDEEKTRAFTATRLASDALRRRAFDLLGSALSEGSTLRDFQRALADDEVGLGITPSSSGYIENVFRTNIGTAYNAGRYRQITSDVVRAARPYVEYRSTIDSRTTPICRALNGMVFSQDDPAWAPYAPPNHYQCRGVTIARREPPAGRSVTDASTLAFRPMDGFDTPP